MRAFNFALASLALASALGCDPNEPPVAVAGDDATAFVNELIPLDGSESFDPDGDALTYTWEVLSAPPGAMYHLEGADTATPMFLGNWDGTYELQLTVDDGRAQDSDTVLVEVDCLPPVEVSAFDPSEPTWEERNPPLDCPDYHVVSSTVVPRDETLTLEPGVYVIVDPDTTFGTGEGRLVAEGAAEARVRFGAAEEVWDGLYLADSPEVILRWALIEQGGAREIIAPAAATLVVSDSHVLLERTIVRDGVGFGIVADTFTTFEPFDRNEITGHAEAAAFLHLSHAAALDAGSTYAGNEWDGVRLHSGDLIEPASWAALDVPYVIGDATRTGTTLSAPLELEPGARIELLEDNALTVTSTGSLTAVGTEEDPIVFSGREPVPGSWAGLSFLDTIAPENRLEHAVVEHAGGRAMGHTGGELVALAFTSSGGSSVSAEVRSVEVRQSAGYGIYLSSYASLDPFDGNVLTENATGAAFAHANAVRHLDDDNVYSGNVVDEVVVESSFALERMATWQNLGVPYRVTGAFDESLLVTAPWTVEAGVRVLFDEGHGGVHVPKEGLLETEGTMEEPVLFSGVEPERGSWKGILLSSSSTLSHTVVEHGGGIWTSSQTSPANVTVLHTGGDPIGVSISGGELRESASHSLWIVESPSVVVVCGDVTLSDPVHPTCPYP